MILFSLSLCFEQYSVPISLFSSPRTTFFHYRLFYDDLRIKSSFFSFDIRILRLITLGLRFPACAIQIMAVVSAFTAFVGWFLEIEFFNVCRFERCTYDFKSLFDFGNPYFRILNYIFCFNNVRAAPL